MPDRILQTVPLALLLLMAPAFPAVAQSSAPGADEIPASAGVFTVEQAGRGQALFRTHCAECHVMQQFTGNAFMRAWTNRRAYDLFELIRTTMPMTNPGRLSRQVYADIVAYLLQANELPAGPAELPSDDDGLRRIRLTPEKNESR